MLELLRKHRILISLALLLLVALFLYSAHLRRRDTTSALEQKILTVLYPLQRGTDLFAGGVASVWARLFGASAGESARLQGENLQLKSQLVRMEEYRLENLRLQQLLDFGNELELRSEGARVIGEDATSWFRTVTIDKGTAHGLREGLAVVNNQGVVGRIIRCTARTSRVLLVTDASSAVASMVERTRTRGVSRGTGDGITLDYVALPEDVKEGDIIISSGLGGVFPKGLMIGTVAQVVKGGYGMFQTIEIVPAVDMGHLEEVLVLHGAETVP